MPVKNSTSRRDTYLRKKYGITEEVYQVMLKEHDGRCWICLKYPTNKPLNVDHDHKTGQVRGLLCFFCNKFLVGRRRREHAHLFSSTHLYLSNPYDWRDRAIQKPRG